MIYSYANDRNRIRRLRLIHEHIDTTTQHTSVVTCYYVCVHRLRDRRSLRCPFAHVACLDTSESERDVYSCSRTTYIVQWSVSILSRTLNISIMSLCACSCRVFMSLFKNIASVNVLYAISEQNQRVTKSARNKVNA